MGLLPLVFDVLVTNRKSSFVGYQREKVDYGTTGPYVGIVSKAGIAEAVNVN